MSHRTEQAQASRSRPILLVVGALLVLAGVALAALTEQGLIGFYDAAQRHGGQILDLGGQGQPLASAQGYMVRVTGQVRVDEAPLDAQFNQQASTPALLRHVEMFQWHEMKMGGPPVYEQDWEDHPVDSGRFSPGHANPGRFPLESREFDAGRVRVGPFVLSPAIQRALPGSEQVTPDLHRLPANLAASFSLYQGALVTSARPANPQLGDLRVSWEAVPTGTVTIVARLDGNRLVPAGDAADGKGFDVEVGDRPLLAIFPDLPVPPEFVWPRRILSVLLAALGTGLLLCYRSGRFDPALAVGAGVATVGAVSGVLWLGDDMGTAAAWFGLTALGIALAVWRLKIRGQAI
jgi:hypothetical protein